LVNESEDFLNEGLDKDNFRHLFGRMFGTRTDYLDLEDFIDDLIRIKKGKQPSSNYKKLLSKIGPKDKDTATAEQLKEYLDYFPNSQVGKDLQKKNKERYEIYYAWLHKLWEVKAGEEEKENARRKRERDEEERKRKEEEEERAYRRSKDKSQGSMFDGSGEGYSDFGYLGRDGQRYYESEKITEASDGNCVMVRYKSPCDKGVKEYNVRMTIDEL